MRELCELLEKYSHVRPATPEDNAAILAFLERQSMKAGEFVLDFERRPNFFHFSGRHSDRHLVFLILNDDQTISGIGSVLIKKCWIKNHIAQVGYFCDLRVDPKANRKSQVQWRKAYVEIIANLKSPESSCYCENIFTAVLAENQVALNSLTKKLRGLAYSPVTDYAVTSLISKLPLRTLPESKIKSVDSEEDDAFFEFLEKEAKNHNWSPLGSDGSARAEWKFRTAHWPEWNEGVSFIARDQNDKVVGCVKAWKDHSRKLVAKKLPRHLRWLGRLFPRLGRPSLHEGAAVEVLQLSDFFIDSRLSSSERKLIALKLLDLVYSHPVNHRVHIINWVANPGDPDLDDLVRGRYLKVTTLGRLFEVHLENQPASLAGNKESLLQRYYFDGTL